MARDFSRSDRVAEQIRRELAELIQLEVKDPGVRFVTLTAVEVTSDFTHAKVFFTTFKGESEVPPLLKGLQRAAPFLRRALGKRIRIHTLPELHFIYDESIERGAQLSALIDSAVSECATEAPEISEETPVSTSNKDH